MCGINGIVFLGKRSDFGLRDGYISQLDKMNDSIAHRGPDSVGTLVRSPIAFGFRRLSIIDLSEAADQPMESADGEIVLIFNGEIYNYLEIRADLIKKGHPFRTSSDTEVIINAYLQYGDQCVQHFNGMWSFALYDYRRNRLLCSRDRLGVKPFYYSIAGQHLVFSSELKAIRKISKQAEANNHKVYEYLTYGFRINDGETFFDDCSELLPGTNMIYENGQLALEKYWTLGSNMYKHSKMLNYHEEYIQLFKDAVKLRYRSDVPVGILLSGGLDSSAITKVTDNLIDEGALSQNEVHAFVASFPNFKYDETQQARALVKECKHIHLHEMQIESTDVIDDFQNTLYAFDHPLGSFASIAHNNIMKACAGMGIKVVLNGQGSDEAYAGYDRYISGVYLLDQLLTKGGKFWKEFLQLNRLNTYSKAFLIQQMIKSVLSQPYASYLRAKFQERSITCLNQEFVRDNRGHYQSEYKFALRGDNFNSYLLNQINHQGLNTILHYEDISSMKQSIEIRSPFLDYRIMEFAFSIPTHLKFSSGVTKVIQRETIGKTLPKSITNNRQKIGFSTPFTEYIKSDPNWKSYISSVLDSPIFKSRSIWDPEKVARKFQNPGKHPDFPFWRFLNLEVWARAYNITNL